ncbi:MAG: hypothetical protein IJA15_08735 [Clostridia bacterium]|nr:hypothetical protein [Clostridia bacterium]
MDSFKKTHSLILKQVKTYPKLELQDLFKFLFQSSFGCEHLISSKQKAEQYISEEYSRLLHKKSNVEKLDGNYSRVHLGILSKGLTSSTLATLFYLSAKKEENGIANLKTKLDVLKKMISNGELPFCMQEFKELFLKWEKAGFTAIHHSDEFKQNYSPAYRLIANEYLPYLPLFIEIDKLLSKTKAITVVAIDGGSASGKSTLGNILKSVYGCNLFHTDDFFLQLHQKTAARLNEPGGNMDRERFLQEILIPLSKNEEVIYKKFNCQTQSLSEEIKVTPGKLCVIEGCYSMHPDLVKHYDYCVFLEISPLLQKKRILKRNQKSLAKKFFKEWIPLENAYFQHFKIKQTANLIIKSKQF